MRWILTLWLALMLGASTALSATVAETRAFRTAMKPFEDSNFALAERWLAEFAAKYPSSEHRPEAVLYQARSRYQQTNYAGAIELLQTQLPMARNLADQYCFWWAQTLYQSGQFEAAAGKYGELIQQYPDSQLVVAGCYGQALAVSRLGNWQRVVDLLNAPDGPFRRGIRAKPGDPSSIEGMLLLGEALYRQSRFAEGEQVLHEIDGQSIDADLQWRQQYWMYQLQVGGKKFENALATGERLAEVARQLGRTALLAQAVFLQAEVLERMERFDDAMAVYERNMGPEAPPDAARHALLKMVELAVAQHRPDDAIGRLDKFINSAATNAPLDLACFSLGELRLTQLFQVVDGATNSDSGLIRSNLLAAAVTNFDTVITNFAMGELVGKAYLNRGWCDWIGQQFDTAEKDFGEAVVRLPRSEEQAIARFKLADAQFKRGDFTNACANYALIATNYAELHGIKSTLLDQALYQLVRANLAGGDVAGAEAAMRMIEILFPNTGFAERSVLLVGQGLNRKGSPAQARALFQEFAAKAPTSALLPEVNLAIARTYVQEGNWKAALAQLDQWIATFPDHALLCHAEFSRALATYHAGMETNALSLLTNFLVRFPSNALSPLAQNWVAEFYYNRADYQSAEANYLLVQKFGPDIDLACRAKMGAGRSATGRQDYNQAAKYFRELINDTNTPTAFIGESYFALADASFSQFLSETNRASIDATNYFDDAVAAISKVIKTFATNSIATLALGRRAEYHLQWGQLKEDAAKLELAFADYTNLLALAATDAKARAQAEIGIGLVLEQRGRLDDALDHYGKVLYADDDSFDAKNARNAGLLAARLCESRDQWLQAIKIYERLLQVVPSLRTTLEKKIGVARGHLASEE